MPAIAGCHRRDEVVYKAVVKSLVIADEAPLRELVCELLRARGHAATGCDDVAAAWRQLEAERPELLVVDVERPGIDGLALCRRLRALPGGDRPAVLAMAGRTQDVAAVLDAGATDVLATPFDRATLELRLALLERQATANAARATVEAEREALLAEAEAARRRSTLLDEASHLLAGSLDYDTTLTTVARLAVPLIADYCIVDVVEPDRETPRQVAVVHVDPAQAEMLREMRRRYPPDPQGPNPASRALRGQQVLVPAAPPALLDQLAQDDEQARMLARLGSARA